MRRVLSEADLREFRERVCAVATELLAEQGYDGFNMRELAGRLGVSAMTTYRYFDSKNEIFAALRVQAFNGLADRLEGFPDLPGSPFEQFVAFCRAYMDFAHEEPVRYRLMFDLSPPQTARSAELVSAERRVFQALVDQAGSFAARGQPEISPERLVQNLWASLHGLAALAKMETFRASELDGLLLDMACRFAGSSSHRTLSELKPLVTAMEQQPHLADRANGALKSNWAPLTAAE
jgi:AcrR family transcriptional regulator